MNTVVMNTAHARAMLAKRYTGNEWALMEEVAPATGGGTTYADAVVVNLWKSRGHAIHGFEIKVSRSDWLRELKKPEKAESVFAFCDHWWILAPAGVVIDGELPITWGQLQLNAAGIVQVKAAPKLTPKPITRDFFASLVRRSTEGLAASAKRLYEEQLSAARGGIEQRIADAVKVRTQRHEELAAQVKAFEEATGLSLRRSWGAGIAAETIKLAQRLESLREYGGDPVSRLRDMAKQLETASTTIHTAIAESGLADPPKQGEPNEQ